jgi:hypothetical protein
MKLRNCQALLNGWRSTPDAECLKGAELCYRQESEDSAMSEARIHFKQVPLTVVIKIMKLQAKQKKTASLTAKPR